MEWHNVDFSTNKISYIPRKTKRKTKGRCVTLPIHPNLLAALQKSLIWRDQNKKGCDYILPNIAARYEHNPGGIQRDVMKIIHCALGINTTAMKREQHRKLPANEYSLHSFRHTFVSFCANAGVPLAVVAEIVGHGSPAMTRHYAHISEEAKQAAIDHLPFLVESMPNSSIPFADGRMEIHRLVDSMSQEQLQKLLATAKVVGLDGVK